uniref:Asparagine--tRNA ligase, cytoplasmic 1-like n=1 Tax=Tanacetum cinerariifolium TaxID=118510 RepID=A0A6L2MTQ2_TANCI|nr:asparagine--tRNA ligase, cytoplasmic 1-like [Tanacetum cinerariifolium]
MVTEPGKDNLFSIELHHDGKFTPSPKRRYVGGKLNYVDKIDMDLFKVDELHMFVKDLRYDPKQLMFYYNKLPDKSLDYGLRPLSCGADVVSLIKLVANCKEVEVFVEYWLTNVDHQFLSPVKCNVEIDVIIYDVLLNALVVGSSKTLALCWINEADVGESCVDKNANVHEEQQTISVNDYSMGDTYELDIDENLNLKDYTVYVHENIDENMNVNADDKIAKAKAEVQLRGDQEQQYALLWNYCDALKKAHPNTTVKIDVYRAHNPHENVRRFKRIYVYLAVSVDANNGIYYVAYGIVESESKESWTWFLSCLGDDLDLEANSNFTFITDRQKGLLPALKDLFHAIEHRCVRHIYDNMNMIYKGGQYKELDDMNCAEAYVRFRCQWLLDNCRDEMEFMVKNVDKNAIKRLQMVASTNFVRLSYTEAVTILEEAVAKGHKFKNHVEWEVDLAPNMRSIVFYIFEIKFESPVIVYNYPQGIKAFYMKLNEDKKTVAAMDVLVPKVGELIGGSQREKNYEVIKERMLEMWLPLEPYEWYLDLRRSGTVKHSGFGMGFERMVLFATGIDIRDVIPFPRTSVLAVGMVAAVEVGGCRGKWHLRWSVGDVLVYRRWWWSSLVEVAGKVSGGGVCV